MAKTTLTLPEAAKWAASYPPTLLKTILDAGSAGLRSCLERHFIARQKEPRKDGFPPQGFWANTNGKSVNESIQPTVFTAAKATIPIASAALAHKIDPSPPPIRPKRAKFLTLPAIAAAATRPARDIPDLKFGYAPTGEGEKKRPALLQNGIVYYWLARQVHTPHDPRALPSDPDLRRHLITAISPALANAAQPGKTPPN